MQLIFGCLVFALSVASPQDGASCVDTSNQCLEWAWKGECDRNANYMRSACALACGACVRDASATATVEFGAGGDVAFARALAERPDDLHGVVPDPGGRWAAGPIRNPLAAMERSDANRDEGVSIDVIHQAPKYGTVDFFWMSDGTTRGEDVGPGVKMYSIAPGDRKRLGTFVGHVFRVAASDGGETLTSFRVLSHRPTYEITEDAVTRYADEEWCKDSHPSCKSRAARGECQSAPGWMVMKCSRSCETCHLRDPELRCSREKLNVKQTPGIVPGGVEALFANLAARWPEFNVTVHSRPGGDPEHPDLDVADGPWVATLGGFVSEAEGAGIIGTVDTQFSRSTDQGAVDRYGEQAKVVSQSRTSENAWCTGSCETHPATVAVMSRIEAVTGIPTENYESFQVLRYTKGQEYRAHHDMSRGDNRLACGPRVYTFFLYLSDVEEGGETEFPLIKRPSGATVKVTPRRGTALIWPSVRDRDPTAQDPRTRHAALPVIEGVKFAANAWIHMFDYEQPNVWGCTGAFD